MLNPFAPGFFDNPYAQYQAVREQDPVHLSPIGAWALFRYEDVYRVLRDPHLSVEERHANLPPPTIPADLQDLVASREQRGNHTMLNLDPPDHHRLRRLVSKVFTPRMIEELRPRVQELVDQYLDEAEARGTGEMDVIADLAFPLPFTIISEMLGIPDDGDRDQLREWSGAIVKGFDPILSPDEIARDGRRERRAVEPRQRPRRVEAREPGRRPAHRHDRSRGRRRSAHLGRARRAAHPALRRRPRDDREPHRQWHARAAAQPRSAGAAATGSERRGDDGRRATALRQPGADVAPRHAGRLRDRRPPHRCRQPVDDVPRVGEP